MKIGILSSICNSHSGARAPIELGISLARRGNKVVFFFMDKGRDEKTYRYIKRNGAEALFFPVPSFGLGNIKVAFGIAKKIKDKKIDVLSSHTIPSYHLGGVISGKPIVLTYHGTQFDPLLEYVPPDKKIPIGLKILNTIGNFYVYLRVLFAVITSKKTVSISRYVGDELKKLYLRNSSVLYWGAVPYYFEDVLPEASVYQKRADEHVILTVSRLTPYKGFDRLIGTFKSVLGNVTLIIACSSPIPSYLSYIKKISGKRVKILIDVSDEELLHLYKIADIYATCDRYLFFGMPILEAAYFGVPAVALDFCAAKEVIKDGSSGFAVKNTNSLAKKLNELIENKKLRKTLGIVAKERAEREFDWRKTAQSYEETFKEVIKR